MLNKTVSFRKQFINCPIDGLTEIHPLLQHLPLIAFFDNMFDEAMSTMLANQRSLNAKVDKNDTNFLIVLRFADFLQFCGDITHFLQNPFTGQPIVVAREPNSTCERCITYFRATA